MVACVNLFCDDCLQFIRCGHYLLALVFRDLICNNTTMNWETIISELMGAGLSQELIAKKCGTSQSNISSLLNGSRKSPGWPIGDSLIRLHKRACKVRK